MLQEGAFARLETGAKGGAIHVAFARRRRYFTALLVILDGR